MKKIIIFSLFVSFVFSYQLSLAETYPTTCDLTAQAVISGLGGCAVIDCTAYSNICAKCCTQVTTQTSCTSFSYSNWSTCQSNRIQTRNIVLKSPTGCTGGTPVISQSCVPSTTPIATSTPPTTPTPSSLISAFTSSKNEIVSGETIALSFSGPSTISKYKIYFSCPKFSTGLNSGLLAASVKISDIEYCNKDFSVPANSKTQNAVISSKYSKPLKITVRLKAYDSKDEYVDYKDVIMTVQPTSTAIISVATSTPVATISTSTTAVSTSTTSITTSLQEQLNFLLNKVRALQQQLLDQQASSASATPSAASASASESITEAALFNEPAIFSYTWNKDLYYGMRNNDDVKALQRALTKEGVYSEQITGNFFGLTRRAVIDFQKKHNFTSIPSSGYVGSYTRKILNGLYSK